MNIRIMKIYDYDDVFALWLSCDGMGLNNLDDSREGIEKFLNRNPDTCFVAEDDNSIIGVILVVFDKNKKGNGFWEKMGFSQRDDLVYRNKSIALNYVKINRIIVVCKYRMGRCKLYDTRNG